MLNSRKTAADQQPQQQRIGRHLAADRHRNALARRRATHLTQQTKHRRMQRLVPIRHAVVGAIDRQRVLNQVVRADREEVHFASPGATR